MLLYKIQMVEADIQLFNSLYQGLTGFIIGLGQIFFELVCILTNSGSKSLMVRGLGQSFSRIAGRLEKTINTINLLAETRNVLSLTSEIFDQATE